MLRYARKYFLTFLFEMLIIKSTSRRKYIFLEIFFAGLGCGDHQEKNSEKPN